MTTVVDTTVVFCRIRPSATAIVRFALLTDAERRGDDIVAPSLLWFELTNAIRKRMRRERIPIDVGLRLLADCLLLPIDRIDPPGLHMQALLLAEQHSLGGHDAHYVALAAVLGCDLWVDDGRLLRAASALPFVRWIGDYVGR